MYSGIRLTQHRFIEQTAYSSSFGSKETILYYSSYKFFAY